MGCSAMVCLEMLSIVSACPAATPEARRSQLLCPASVGRDFPSQHFMAARLGCEGRWQNPAPLVPWCRLAPMPQELEKQPAPWHQHVTLVLLQFLVQRSGMR